MAGPDDHYEVTDEVIDLMIARRAYEISQSDERRSDLENWIRAERELKTTPEPDAAA
jgi:hypothetical protein